MSGSLESLEPQRHSRGELLGSGVECVGGPFPDAARNLQCVTYIHSHVSGTRLRPFHQEHYAQAIPSEEGHAPTPIRIGVVEDHAMFRESIVSVLAAEPDLEVVTTAGNIATAETSLRRHRPDVALIDYALPDGTGVQLASSVQGALPEIACVIITGSESIEAAADAVGAGCAGFVSKTSPLDVLTQSIRRAYEGEAAFDAQTLAAAVTWLNRPRAPETDLTRREIEILGELARGHSTAEISGRLFLSHHTVRNHVRNILTKLDAHSQLQAVAIAAARGIVRVGADGPGGNDTT